MLLLPSLCWRDRDDEHPPCLPPVQAIGEQNFTARVTATGTALTKLKSAHNVVCRDRVFWLSLQPPAPSPPVETTFPSTMWSRRPQQWPLARSLKLSARPAARHEPVGTMLRAPLC